MIKTFTLTRVSYLFITIFLTAFYSESFAQCAGDDASLIECNKSNNRYLDLFAALGPNAVAGGTWTNNNNTGGLNRTTGVLDTHEVIIGGVFTYTYTVEGQSGCTDNSSIVTVTLGSFPGENNSNVVACSDDNSVNLFQFTGSSPSPTLDGSWSSINAPSGSLMGSLFNAEQAGPGNYTFTYTVPAQGACPSSSSTVQLEVIRTPESGTAMQQIFCETDDLSAFTSFDLQDVLMGEDQGGIWTENSGTNEISSTQDSFIDVENIRDSFGPGIYSFSYTVNPLNPACAPSTTNVSIEIEDVLNFNGATFAITQPSDDVCFAELPLNVTAEIDHNTATIPDGTYQLTYQVGPAPNQGSETISITFTDGLATFDLNSNFFTAVGDATVEITEIIDPSSPNNCAAEIPQLTDTISINAMPDPSDSQVVVNEPICEGNNATFIISDAANTPQIELEDGVYEVAYTIDGPDGEVYNASSVTISGGQGTGTIPSTEIPSTGSYTIRIDSFETGQGCVTTANITDAFEVSPIPDAQQVSVVVADTCEDDSVTVYLTDSNSGLGDGDFTIDYDITGDINQTGLSETVTFADGMASFTLDPSILVNGTSTLTITNIVNTISTCDATNFSSPASSFTIYANPDLSNSTLTVEDSCQNEIVTASITDSVDNIPDGEYNLTYTINGVEQTVEVTAVDGDTSFDIPASFSAETGNKDLVVTNFVRVFPTCSPTAGLPLNASYEITPVPTLEQSTLTIENICFGESPFAQITGATVADGSYQISYQITSENAITISVDEVVTFTGGNATFNIDTGNLSDDSEITITITGIVEQDSGNACSSVVNDLSVTFTQNQNPDLSSTALTALETVCLGDAGTVFLTDPNANLSDGDYVITYSLSGANNSTGLTDTITVTNGEASFSVDASLLTATGSYTVTVDSIANASTSCSTAASMLIADFNVTPTPDLTNASISTPDTCADETNFNVTLDAPALADGSYTIMYTLSGANEGSYFATNVPVSAGQGNFDIDPANLANTGETTITVTTVTNDQSDCFTDALAIAYSFDINVTPQVASEDLTATDACLGDSVVITYSGTGLDDGNYDITYTLTGDNAMAETNATITVTDGVAQFTVLASSLTEVGTTTFTITSATNTLTTCTNTTAASVTFDVNPIPDASDLSLDAMDICFAESGLATISSTKLVDGNYTVTFDLSGANASTGNTATFALNGGEGLFLIDADLLASAGIQTVTITDIASEFGCDAASASATTDFEITPLPDTTGATLTIADICYGNSSDVIITDATALMDGDYIITYVVDGANAQAETGATLSFVNGASSFELDGSLLMNGGITNVTITSVMSVATQCTSLTNLTGSFNVVDPAPPTIAEALEFCINDSPTIADLIAKLQPATGVSVYDTNTGGTALATTTTLTDGTTYYASATLDGSCEGSTRVALTVDLSACDGLFIPDGFSPNGDGVNDTFEIRNIDLVYPDYTIEFFNRNGQTVFKGNAGTGDWDGRSNQGGLGSGVLPNGVYFYILNYNDGSTKPVQGHIYLNR